MELKGLVGNPFQIMICILFALAMSVKTSQDGLKRIRRDHDHSANNIGE